MGPVRMGGHAALLERSVLCSDVRHADMHQSVVRERVQLRGEEGVQSQAVAEDNQGVVKGSLEQEHKPVRIHAAYGRRFAHGQLGKVNGEHAGLYPGCPSDAWCKTEGGGKHRARPPACSGADNLAIADAAASCRRRAARHGACVARMHDGPLFACGVVVAGWAPAV